MMKKIIISILLLLFTTFQCWAGHSVTVSPTSTTISSTGFNPLINISWSLINGTANHVSTSASFTTSAGVTLGSTINSSLSFTCVGSSSNCMPRSEEFSIPADVLSAVANGGLTTIFYTRVFFNNKDLSDTFTGKFQIIFSSPPSTTATNPERTLHITRESLRFNDNTIVKVIKPNSRISAVAELNFTGTGLLDAFWEYATPSSTRGRAIFIRLGSVRRYLGVGGRVILQSPPLPTDLTGQYVLRLQILKTLSNPNGVEFTSNLPDGLPLLRYSVNNQGGSDVVYELPPIKTLFPAGNATLQADTRFNWQAVKNAKAYQLELYLPDENKRPVINPSTNFNDRLIDDSVIKNKKPSTGLLIPATKTSLSLTALSRETLKRSSTYYWRIIAIGLDGRILTTSTLKQIRTP